MSLKLGMITADTTDAEGLGAWWARVTGAEVTETNDGWFVIVKGGGLPVALAFQKVETVTPGKNRLHLDLTTEDLEGATGHLIASGATLVERRGDENFAWHTLADPQGNEFCISGEHAA